jgi:hypothetical protein
MNIELIKSVGTLKSRVTNLWMNMLKISLYNLMAYGGLSSISSTSRYYMIWTIGHVLIKVMTLVLCVLNSSSL